MTRATGARTVVRMAHAGRDGARETFLVEQYRPGAAVEGLLGTARDVRESAGELERQGKAVRFLRSTVVPGDEALLCLLEAASEELVREAYERAGIAFDRISPVVTDA